MTCDRKMVEMRFIPPTDIAAEIATLTDDSTASSYDFYSKEIAI